ncbi:MAG TPA: phage holin family protein [Verrucomicrobiae bacterium]|nr:phage holin family protein [Verrucomicrobiae bacterium]
MNATLNTASPRTERFVNLVSDLQNDVKTLIKKEVELAKAEIGEKFKAAGRNATFAAIGGVMALMAVFLLLLGIGAIIARLLQKADLSPGTSYFLAYMGLGLVLGGVGYALIHKAVHAFSELSLSPEKAVESVKGAEPVPIEIRKQIKSQEKDKKPATLSSDELQTQVRATRSRMEDEISELKTRLTPAYMAKSLLAGMKHHPLRVLFLSAASTGVGGFIYWRKQQHIQEIKKQAHCARRWWLKLKHA